MNDPNTWLYVIGFFGLIFIIVLIVSFIGNKMSDGVENALRRRKHAEQPQQKTKSESLADRYTNH